ncbi:hypothetical protein RGCCGE502_18570 [Rhizobium grahamii CCGE 502]|uniref:Uncharacterized protein n=1 Tax=Rhizobium grahamii CCGE 502 TaxID=990285 RepID=S3HU32_9HYPH|nr:hypothetical protein RGCCGE502_18570 [Rhizobium grahamii CCGE 502]
MPAEPREFFMSSNGDRWFLDDDQASPDPIVIHRANLSSGGAETTWSISSFLKIAADHPQGRALREFLQDHPTPDRQSNNESSPSRPKDSNPYPWARKSERDD